MSQTRYLGLIWRSEGNEATFLNTWEWVEIVQEETATNIAAIDDILAIPGTIPRQRQTESHADPHPRYQQVDDLTSDIVKRVADYVNWTLSGPATESYSPTYQNQMSSTRFTRKPDMKAGEGNHGHALQQYNWTYWQQYSCCEAHGERMHPRDQCPARGLTCYQCGKIGHYGSVCRSPQRPLQFYTIPGRYTEVPRQPYYPLYYPTSIMHPPQGKRKNLKETGLLPAKKKCLDAGMTAGCKKPDQITSHPIKKEPVHAHDGVANTKPNVDVVEQPDIKPDIGLQHGKKGSFIS